MKKMLLVDGNSMIFRAYFATAYGRPMTTSNGIHTNAVYGFNMMINKAIELVQPDYIMVAFDAGKQTFRHEIYKDYKGGRKPTPEELVVQFPIVRELLDAMGITWYEMPTIEADDIVGTVAKAFPQYEANILTSDHDLLQLIDKTTSVWLMKKGLTEIDEMTVESLYETYHLSPSQIIDLKGLMGDNSDNIPGIPGVGEKTAIKLLEDYGTVENLLAHTDELKGKLKEKVENGKESALLSKKLATICTTVDLGFKEEDLTVDTNNRRLAEFYKKYEMHSFLKNLEIEEEEPVKEETVKGELVTTVPSEFYKDGTVLYLDADTDNYHYAHCYGFALANAERSVYIYYEDAAEDKAFMEYLGSNLKKTVYDAKNIYHLCDVNNIKIQGIEDDLMIVSFLVDNFVDSLSKLFEKYQISLKDLREEIYGKPGKMKLPDSEMQVDFATAVASALAKITPQVLNQCKELQMEDLYRQIELPLTYILFDMEKQGIRVDLNTLNEIADKTKLKLDELQNLIYGYANKEFNINSTKQLAEILFDDLGLPTGKKRSTAADVLEKLAGKHPIVECLIEYRKYQKLYSTYAEGLKKYVDTDGKIHTIYTQTVTQTGRLSSTEPNLQNISVRTEEGREIRKAFIPESDSILISCDYSQVELRVLAHMANEKELIAAFNSGMDIHAATASRIFNVPMDEVTSLMRRQAKAVNFGIVYGISDFGLSEQLAIPRKEAQQFIDRYLESYPGISEFMNSTVQFCKDNGYVETLWHRRRMIPEINDKNYMIREFGKRAAMNAPVQGTAADLIKIAMVRIFNRLLKENCNAKIILQIHDEVVLNVPKCEVEKVSAIISEEMESAMQLQVPLISALVTGNTWYEAK